MESAANRRNSKTEKVPLLFRCKKQGIHLPGAKIFVYDESVIGTISVYGWIGL